MNTTRTPYLLLLPALAWSISIGCGGSSTPSPPGNGGSNDNAVPIVGNERIGWDQSAPVELIGSYRYSVYVDSSNRAELTDANCSLTSSERYACSARLPSLSTGRHTLELATWIITNGQRLESARSAPLVVQVSAGSTPGIEATSASAPAPVDLEGGRPAGGGALVVTGTNAPLTGLAHLPDGRFLFSDGTAIGVIDPESRRPSTRAVRAGQIDRRVRGRFLAVAADPDFSRNRLVFALALTERSDGRSGLGLVRLREAGGRLGELATIFNYVVDARPSSVEGGAVRVGPDGLVYASVQLARSSERPFRAILRVERDGRVPLDQGSRDPVFLSTDSEVIDFDWTRDGTMVVLQRPSAEEYALTSFAPSASRPFALDPPQTIRKPLTSESRLVGLRADPVMSSEVLIALNAGVSRVDSLASGGTAATEVWSPEGGTVTALDIASDGAVYVALTLEARGDRPRAHVIARIPAPTAGGD